MKPQHALLYAIADLVFDVDSLLPSSPAGRAIGYRQTLAYLTRQGWERGDDSALKEFVRDFAAVGCHHARRAHLANFVPRLPILSSRGATWQVSRQYAGQQTKWFRSEPSFEWVAADWCVTRGTPFLPRQSNGHRFHLKHTAGCPC